MRIVSAGGNKWQVVATGKVIQGKGAALRAALAAEQAKKAADAPKKAPAKVAQAPSASVGKKKGK